MFDDQYVALRQRHSPARQRIQKFVHERISGPYIARQGKRNDAQFLARSILVCSERVIAEIPLSREPLRAGLAGEFEQLLEIRGIVDVHSDARKRKHDAGFTGGLRRRKMGLETIIAEMQREQCCWA